MNLPSYPGQPQPEEPKGSPEGVDLSKPEAPQPAPPAGAPLPPPPAPAAPVGPPMPPAAPAYPGGGGATPPPPPGGPVAPPYGAPYQPFAGANDGTAGYSGVAIASFVCSLTCCLGIPAVILGAIGIAKTGAGKARGRWMAVTGLVLGVLGTILLVAIGLGLAFVGSRVVTPSNAEPGQCVQVTTEAKGNSVAMIKTDCGSKHNGQIYAVVTPTAADVSAGRAQMELCVTRLAGVFPGAQPRVSGGAAHLELSGEDVELASASTHARVRSGDPVACWIEATDGKLDADYVD